MTQIDLVDSDNNKYEYCKCVVGEVIGSEDVLVCRCIVRSNLNENLFKDKIIIKTSPLAGKEPVEVPYDW